MFSWVGIATMLATDCGTPDPTIVSQTPPLLHNTKELPRSSSVGSGIRHRDILRLTGDTTPLFLRAARGEGFTPGRPVRD